MHGFIKGGGVVVTIGYLYLIPFKIEARCRFFCGESDKMQSANWQVP